MIRALRIALATALMLAVGVLALPVPTVYAMTGSGTADDPYIISSATDLQNMESSLSAYYELGGDIDATATSGWNGGDGFDPVGDNGTEFTGSLDGKCYIIDGLYIDRNATNGVGLFGWADEATVQDVYFTNSDITGDNWTGVLIGQDDSSTVSNCHVLGGAVDAVDSGGGLIGYSYQTTVTDCYSSATVAVSTTDEAGGLIGTAYSAVVTDCRATGTVTAADDYAGGLIGYASACTVTGCSATGNVTAVGYNVGGLVGEANQGSISQCYATGDAESTTDDQVGGFIGLSFVDISNCYALGDATSGDDYAGGFIGSCNGKTVTNCYSIGVPTATGGVGEGGFIGANFGTDTGCFWDTDTSGTVVSDGGTGKTTAQMKTTTTFSGASWNLTTIWSRDESDGINSGYPYLIDLPDTFAEDSVVSVPDTSNDWIFIYNNSGVYVDSYHHAVSGDTAVFYSPVDMIESTTESGTADAGTAVTLDDAILTQANDYWNGSRLEILTTTDHNAPEGETSVVTDFDAANDRLTFDTLTAVVDAGDTYRIAFGTLPDRESTAEDARITWGIDPSDGYDVELGGGGAVSGDQPPYWLEPDDEIIDVLPDAPTTDWFEDPDVGGTLLTNPLRPFVTILSDTTTMTELQAWRLLGLAFVLFVLVACVVIVRGHLVIAGSATGAAIGLLIALTIWPFWTLVLAIGSVAGGLVAERSPAL